MTVVDHPPVRSAVARSADPAFARVALERLLDSHPWLADRFVADAQLVDALVAVSVASRTSFVLLERDPGAVEALGSEHLRDAIADPRAHVLASDDPSRELRRWKRRELVRIAARDLLGLASLRDVGRDLAALAEHTLRAALDIVAPSVRMAVIGMGKLGGEELNYASDVDVLFVHEGDTPAAERAARELLRVMTAPSPDGIVFRTDADLRPEGRSGALSRSLDAYETYWERWAQTWERQSLIKARAVAGDAALARDFSAAANRFVWQEWLDPNAVREIRAMKTRTEEQLVRRGTSEREVKRGYGGIRDIEFAVQLLQLVHGRADANVRARGTLDALEQLVTDRYVSAVDAEQLERSYVWLRTVEHRLQLVEEQQTHTLPVDGLARTHLARVLGFRDRRGESAAEQFDAEHRRQQAVVRTIHEKLFFAPILDTLAGVGVLADAAFGDRLVAFGFHDVDRTRAALRELTAGLTRRSRVMQQLMPAILGWLSSAPDPDLGLLQLRRLSEGYTRASTLARRFRETPIAAERTCRITGSSRVLGLALHRHPDAVDALADDAFVHDETSREALVESALGTLDWRHDEDGRRAGLRRFKRRELLRVGARDLCGGAALESIGRELAHVADACIEAALRSLEPAIPFAVIGLGRLGGRELSYASDIDVVFAYDGSSPRDFYVAERLASRLVRAIGQSTTEGSTFRVDARLRPEGAQGPLARSLDAYRVYYERWGQTWELQALTRARAVAGDERVAARFLEIAHGASYRDPMPDTWRREIRRMKARIERERIPPGEDPRFHLKLGRGSLSDVEFTVQLEQLAHGALHDAARDPSTSGALAALVELGAIDAKDAKQLLEAYRLCERARNYRYLLTGTPSDALPTDGDEAEKLARMLGYNEHPQQSLRDDYRRVTRRARAVVERVFYGRE